jgi:rsbT co-antagonist protein RsbR
MAKDRKTRIPEILQKHEATILSEWTKHQFAAAPSRAGRIEDREVREQSRTFLGLVREAAQRADLEDISAPEWAATREMLGGLSASRARQGFTPGETATFVLSLKQPLFGVLRQELGRDAEALADEIWGATTLLDSLGLHTVEAFQRTREEIIARQQQDMLELSTPVVELWDGVLALPLIGTLDSARTQVVMENLLQRIVETGATIAIIDITGVPTVDTLVAQHLLKTVAAARLMGADCIISGIRPQIAQTIVHLGVELREVTTKATLADAFAVALARTGAAVVRNEKR